MGVVNMHLDDEREQRRFRDEIARAAREVGRSEARAVAEEALPLDNETLSVSEPPVAYRARRKGKARKR